MLSLHLLLLLLLLLQVCRREWCWVCGRDWQQHSNDTGGYYACNLAPTAAAAADSEQDAGSSSSAQQQQRTSGGVFAAFKAFKSAMLDHKQRQYAAMHMSHEVNARRLTVLLRYQQLLLAAVLQAWEFEPSHTEPAVEAAAAAAAAAGLKGLQRDMQPVSSAETPAVASSEEAAATAAVEAATAAALQLAVGREGLPGARSVASAVATELQLPGSFCVDQQQQQVLVHASIQDQKQQQQIWDCQKVQQQQQQQPHEQQQQQLQQQGFQPLTELLLQQWLDCVVQCKASLRWSCVRGFYLGSTASRRQLEHLTVSAGTFAYLFSIFFLWLKVCRASSVASSAFDCVQAAEADCVVQCKSSLR
jgi:hypothetical protein